MANDADLTRDFHDFVESWHSFQSAELMRTVKSFEKGYLRLKANPPIDARTKKPMAVTPSMGMYLGGGRRFLPYTMSPSINLFSRHVIGGGDGLIGGITPEAAKLRLWVDERQVRASWTFFSKRTLESKRPFPAFSDVVAESDAPLVPFGPSVEIAKRAWQDTSERTSGQAEKAVYETWRLTFSDPSCITCHPSQKLGDPAGLMVYTAKRISDFKAADRRRR